MLTIRPYKTVNNRIDGTVLALVSISSSLRMARDTGEAIMSTVRDPILLLASDQKVQRANRAFYEKFAATPREVEGQCVFDLGEGQWNIPGLRTLLHDVLPDRKNFEDFLVEHQFPRIGYRRMLLDGRRIESGRWGEGVILLIMRDITNAEAS
jgi:two-component system CheB/CheR fusion protein